MNLRLSSVVTKIIATTLLVMLSENHAVAQTIINCSNCTAEQEQQLQSAVDDYLRKFDDGQVVAGALTVTFTIGEPPSSAEGEGAVIGEMRAGVIYLIPELFSEATDLAATVGHELSHYADDGIDDWNVFTVRQSIISEIEAYTYEIRFLQWLYWHLLLVKGVDIFDPIYQRINRLADEARVMRLYYRIVLLRAPTEVLNRTMNEQRRIMGLPPVNGRAVPYIHQTLESLLLERIGYSAPVAHN